MRRTLIWAFLLLVVVFVVGITVGRTVGLRTRGPVTVPPSAVFPGMMSSVIERLELAPRQQTQVNAILERRNAQTDSIVQGVMIGLQAVIDSTRREIRGVLDVMQQLRFDSLLAAERGQMRMRQPRPSSPGNR